MSNRSLLIAYRFVIMANRYSWMCRNSLFLPQRTQRFYTKFTYLQRANCVLQIA